MRKRQVCKFKLRYNNYIFCKNRASGKDSNCSYFENGVARLVGKHECSAKGRHASILANNPKSDYSTTKHLCAVPCISLCILCCMVCTSSTFITKQTSSSWHSQHNQTGNCLLKLSSKSWRQIIMEHLLCLLFSLKSTQLRVNKACIMLGLLWELKGCTLYFCTCVSLCVCVYVCEVVHFNSAGENVPVFDVGGAILHHKDSLRYLGMVFYRTLNMAKSAEHAARPFLASAYRIRRFVREHALADRPHTSLWLAKTYAIPAGMYVSQVWGTVVFTGRQGVL